MNLDFALPERATSATSPIPFRGEEEIDLQSAMQLMDQMHVDR